MIRSVTRPRAGFGDEQKTELYEPSCDTPS